MVDHRALGPASAASGLTLPSFPRRFVCAGASRSGSGRGGGAIARFDPTSVIGGSPSLGEAVQPAARSSCSEQHHRGRGRPPAPAADSSVANSIIEGGVGRPRLGGRELSELAPDSGADPGQFGLRVDRSRPALSAGGSPSLGEAVQPGAGSSSVVNSMIEGASAARAWASRPARGALVVVERHHRGRGRPPAPRVGAARRERRTGWVGPRRNQVAPPCRRAR